MATKTNQTEWRIEGEAAKRLIERDRIIREQQAVFNEALEMARAMIGAPSGVVLKRDGDSLRLVLPQNGNGNGEE